MEMQMSGGAIQSQTNGPSDHHLVITVPPAREDWSTLVQRRLSQRPTRLKETAGNDRCCIFRVPRSLADISPKAYKPRIVSIGPYHHGRECDIKMVEEHKPRYFSKLVARTRDYGVSLDDYFNSLSSREHRIRDCYSQPLEHGSSDLIMMMVLDGCFIIEVFRIVAGVIERDLDDPLFNMMWVFTFLMRDFLQLENQIPFFVLQILYDLSKSPAESQRSLIQLALEFFNWTIQRPPEQLEKYCMASDVKHLLHLLQLTYSDLPTRIDAEPEADDKDLQLIHSAKKLHHAGIKFKPEKSSENLLDIQFDKGVLKIPPLTVDDFTSSFFLNCIAFEQCYCYTNQHVTTYVTFMGRLVSSAADASFLSDRHILENYFGTDAEVVNFFNDLGKDVGFDIESCYLAGVFREVNRYYRKRWRVRWTGMKREYFNSPWSLISAMAAFIILALTFIQAFFAVYAYVNPTSKN